MDTLIKIIIISLLHLIVTPANAVLFDIGDANGTLSGWVKNSDGNYSQVSTNSTRTLLNNTALSVAEKFPIQTSKGIFEANIVRTATVDLSRMGKAVSGAAILGGPVGMTITAVSLICDLTEICNQAGVWVANKAADDITQLRDTVGWYVNSVAYPNLSLASAISTQFNGAGYGVLAGGCNCMATDFQWTPSETGGSLLFKLKNSSGNYISGQLDASKIGAYTPSTDIQPATSNDWTSKEQLLNDPRFTPELIAKDQPVPIGLPMAPSAVKFPIDKTTTTLKDGSGNVTGTEETTTEAEISNPTAQENPTNNPNRLKLTETTVKNTYNINNQLTSSTTTTTGNQPQQPQPQGFEIDIDNMADQPLEERAIPGTFSYTSWGSGSCPADRSVSYHYGTLNLTFQPACDAAVMANPVIIAIAGLAAMFIISGALRND